MDQEPLLQLQERLGVTFKDPALLARALMHRSAATESSSESNERLEFLGDSVVGLVISESLFSLYPDYNEGDLAKSKAYIVSETALAEAAKRLGLEECIRLSAGEAASGGRLRRSILADAFEALIAAVYLDSGLLAARHIVTTVLNEAILTVAQDAHRRDYKSALQEWSQARARIAPQYRILREEGRDHEKTFVAEVLLAELVVAQGTGRSKKEAEQAAAFNALQNLPELPTQPTDNVTNAENRVQ